MKRILTTIYFAVAALAASAQQQAFTLGADVSWYTEMADKGYKFSNGTDIVSCTQLLCDYGMTAARFRVWVNPKNKYNAKDDVVAKARAAANAGLDVLIDFHFSDGWADPGQQTVPAAWQSDTYEKMKVHLASHVTEVLTALKEAGVAPRWVQIGNETNNGMLWDFGLADQNPKQYAGFVAAGSRAAKAVFPDTKVIVHVSNGFDPELFDWNIGIMRSNAVPFDIIGMSLYPGCDENTAETVNKTIDNIRHLGSAFGKNVMIVEVGLPVASGSSGKEVLADIINRAANDTSGTCVGVLYWEPEAPSGWYGYQLGAATESNSVIRFTTVMEAFREGGEVLSVKDVSKAGTSADDTVYNLCGQRVAVPQRGVNIIGGKKVLCR